MSVWTNNSGVTVYVVSNDADDWSGSKRNRWEATLTSGQTFNDSGIQLSNGDQIAFVTVASLESQHGGGTTMSSYMGGAIDTEKAGYSSGTNAYPGSGQWYTVASYSGTVNVTDGSSAGGATVARTKIGHKLLATSGVRRDAIQSGSIEVGHMNFVASEGDASWGGALADGDLFAIHDTSADTVRGIELIDLKSYLSSSVLGATAFNGSITVTGSVRSSGQVIVGEDLVVAGDAGVTGSFKVNGAANFNGAVTLGDATGDDITNTGRWVGDFVPKTDSAIDLGTSALQFAEAHIDHGYIDAITATGTSTLTTVDINGGNIDGTAIGAASHSTGKFTTVDATTDFTIDGLVITADTITNDAALEVVSTGLTLNASLDIALSADGGNVTMDDGTTTVFDFNTDDPELKIMDDAQVANYLSMAVGANGATTIQTVDADAAAANLQITADGTAEMAGTTVTLDSAGDIVLSADGDNVTMDDGTTTLVDFNLASNAPTLKLMDGAQVANYFSVGVAANGATTMTTVDTDAAAANLQITADGTVDIDSAGALTLDSGGAINLEPAAGSAILLDGTISVDAGVVTGATSITSTAFVGGISGGTLAGTTLVATGDVDLGDATSDTITCTGQFDSDLIPSTDSARDLGTSAKQWAEAHVDVGHIDQITGSISGSFAQIHRIVADKLDVRTINTETRTENFLHIQDKTIVVAMSASAANSDGAGLEFGGRLDRSNGKAWAAIKYDNSNSALDFNISGTTQVRLQDGVLRPESDNDVDLGASGAEFKDLYLDGTATIDALVLPDVTSGKILVANDTSYEEVAISGDVTIASNGAVTIAAGAVEHGMLAEDIISGQVALGGATVAQADLLMLDDGPGAVKKITFSNFEDSIFGNVSGDATIAAGGALTIAADAVEPSMMNIFDDSLAATTTHFLIADGTDYSSFALSGDVTCTNAGVVTIANDAVENSMLHKSVVLDNTGSHGGLNFRNGVLSVGSHIYHFMSSSSPTIVSSSANTQLVASTIGSGGDGDYNIYAMTGSKGAGCVTASLGFTTASHGGGMPASGSLKVYLNGILLFGALDRGGSTRTTATNPIPHTSVDYRWDDKKNIQSVVSGSRILLNPNLALDSDDILTVEYLSGTVQGHHSY